MTEVTANLILISICLSVFEQIWTKTTEVTRNLYAIPLLFLVPSASL